jgi:hypothetical protein
MVWRALEWDWKSTLVFLEKLEGKRGICSKAYLAQVLEAVIFPHFDSLSEEEQEDFIFMEDGAKVYVVHARLPKLNQGIRGFEWPPSSPDLNPIEKIWRWMKHEISNLPNPPLSVEALKFELQRLWDMIDSADWRYLTERLTCKLEDVILMKGRSTLH